MSSRRRALLRDQSIEAQPFELPGEPDAVLAVHGFTGTAAEMRPPATRIHDRFGWRVLCPLLPGHGTTMGDLNRKTWTDWIREIELNHDALKRKHERIHLMGLSMGALLVLELLRRRPTDFASLVLIVPAVFLRPNYKNWVTPLLGTFRIYKILPSIPKEHVLPGHVAYPRYPTKGIVEFSRISHRAWSLEPMDSPPTMICYSEADEIVDPRSATFLAERLQNPLTRVVRLRRSTHVVTLGVERSTFLTEMESFYREISPIRQAKPTDPL